VAHGYAATPRSHCDAQLQQLGIVVIRMKNEAVFQNPEGVLLRIKDLFARNRTEPPRPAGTPP
jgi:very-short-patch-repair endonuclease